MQNIPELLSAVQKMHFTIFFHPDYTVGFGVSPNHTLRLAGCTAGRELHPALKILFVRGVKYSGFKRRRIVNPFC